MLLEKHTAVRKGRLHDGKVMVMRSNLRWCSDGLEFTCWNDEVIRLAFIIDAFDREIIAWTAVTNAGISGSDVRDIMLEVVEKRFGATRTPHAIEHLSDNGAAYTARNTRVFAQALNLTPCVTPVASPQLNVMVLQFCRICKFGHPRQLYPTQDCSCCYAGNKFQIFGVLCRQTMICGQFCHCIFSSFFRHLTCKSPRLKHLLEFLIAFLLAPGVSTNHD